MPWGGDLTLTKATRWRTLPFMSFSDGHGLTKTVVAEILPLHLYVKEKEGAAGVRISYPFY
jgi:hypothetical protein